MVNLRRYTLTLKPTKKEYKNDIQLLSDTFDLYLTMVVGSVVYLNIEDRDTDNMHLHALIKCPLIKDKRNISSKLSGWHIKSDLIKVSDECKTHDIWLNYINKSISDSCRFNKLYGDSIPLLSDLLS